MFMGKFNVIIFLVVVLLIISLFFDYQIVRSIANNRISFLNLFMLIFSNAVFDIFLFFVIPAFYFVYSKNYRVSALLAFSMLLAVGLAYLLKIVIMRPRPDVLVLAHYSTFAFPSGHSALVFSALPIIKKYFNKYYLISIIFAVIVAFSRIYVGAHYLSDVISGGLLGYLLGYVVAHYYDVYTSRV